jgi:hypothetical protein
MDDESLVRSKGNSNSNLFSETFSESFINHYPLDVNIPYKKIFGIFSLTYLWTLVLTVLPVVISIGPNNYYNHRNWYSGSDVIRLIEPFGGLILNFLVLYKSGILKKDQNKRNNLCVMTFIFGAGVYLQGSSLHSASTMFKNSLETTDHDDRLASDLAYYMRTVWEHIISHYMYAAGYAIMSACHVFAYKDYKSAHLGLTWSAKCLLVLTSLVYALLIAGVAADFPSGTIVGLIYVVLYGFGCVGGYILYVYRVEHDETVIVFGQRPVLHHFMLSYIFALVLVVSWICYAGGFKSLSEAGKI